MTSIWTDADRIARSAIEAELRRRERLTPETLSAAYARIGNAVSLKAMSLWNNHSALADYVRTALPAA